MRYVHWKPFEAVELIAYNSEKRTLIGLGNIVRFYSKSETGVSAKETGKPKVHHICIFHYLTLTFFLASSIRVCFLGFFLMKRSQSRD
jgi:hypothetical protein